jgi:aquaporin Z
MNTQQKLLAEFFGTFWLVFGGCGSAIFATQFPEYNIGLVGISLAFGLTVVTMAYAVGHISGGHFNPAVSVGLWIGGRFKGSELAGYIIAQVLGAIAAAIVIYIIVSGSPSYIADGVFASNGYGEHSPGKYSMISSLLAEVVLTFFFLLIILGVTSDKAPKGFAPLAIGLALALIHLISIPITRTSVNPARSTGQVLFADSWALSQLWLFWVAPIIGAVLAGLVYKALESKKA